MIRISVKVNYVAREQNYAIEDRFYSLDIHEI